MSPSKKWSLFSQLSVLYAASGMAQRNYRVYIMAGAYSPGTAAREMVEQHISGVEFIDGSLERLRQLHYAGGLISEQDIGAKTTRTTGVGGSGRTAAGGGLKLGDYVVHENYGVGIFRGVTRVETDGVTREYILLQYAGTDKLYLPLDKLDALYRYSLTEDREPRLNKLGGSEWERTKRKVAKSIRDMAEDLLKLYAARQSREGHAFSPDTPWQAQFEESFLPGNS